MFGTNMHDNISNLRFTENTIVIMSNRETPKDSNFVLYIYTTMQFYQQNKLEYSGAPQQIEIDPGRIPDLYQIINFSGLKRSFCHPINNVFPSQHTLFYSVDTCYKVGNILQDFRLEVS